MGIERRLVIMLGTKDVGLLLGGINGTCYNIDGCYNHEVGLLLLEDITSE